MDPWVSVRLTDGLGNRLFQMAALLRAAEKLDRTPVLFLPRMHKYSHGSWKILLDLFPTIQIIESEKEWIEYPEEVVPTYIQDSNRKGIVLKGWFQDLRYFPSLENPLLPRWKNPIGKTLNKVAVFFRLGDYCILPHHQQNLQRYYGEALEKYEKGTELILFSDSIEKLAPIQKELVSKGYPNVICGTLDVEKTIRMALLCRKGLIGGNSTFSWWIGWLAWNAYGRPADYEATYPDVWLQREGPKNLFSLPYTRAIQVGDLHKKEGPQVSSFTYSS